MCSARGRAAVKLNLSNICFDTRELKLKSEKSGRLDSLLIPIPLFKQTVEYIRAHKEQIEKAEGYLFFSTAPESHRAYLWVEQNYGPGADSGIT